MWFNQKGGEIEGLIITDIDNFNKYNNPNSSDFEQQMQLDPLVGPTSRSSNKRLAWIYLIVGGVTYVAGEIRNGVVKAFVDFEGLGYNTTNRILNFYYGNPNATRIYYNTVTRGVSGGGFAGGGGGGSW